MSVTSGTKSESGLGETIRVVIHALLIALVIRTFLFQPFNIPSGSMKATLLVGDYLFVSKYSYGYSHYSIPLSPPLFSGRIFGSEPAAMAEAARMVEAAGADIVDMNFGCPVRKVTKTGAGAHLLEHPDLACRIADAVASAVSVPLSVKMRRGVEDGSRACLDLGPRLVDAGAATLTLHPRSAKQMYTGYADHTLTAELVDLVDVPVIASGDVTSHAKAQAVLAATRASAVMVGRGAQGNPWAIREIVFGETEQPSREEVAAELIHFIHETVRELGERRGSSFLKKFYGWYLGHGRFPKPFKNELMQLESTEDVVLRLLAAAPGAANLLVELEADVPESEILLEGMPISLYGGG